MIRSSLLLAVALFGVLAAAGTAQADPFKSSKDCVSGKRVIERQGRKGVIVKIVDDNLCAVKMDEGGKEENFPFSMLTEQEESPQAAIKLVPGTYECYQNGQYAYMDLYIIGAERYRIEGGSGRFHLDPGDKIVFETGPLAKFPSRLDAGPSVLLSTNGGSSYGTSCQLKK